MGFVDNIMADNGYVQHFTNLYFDKFKLLKPHQPQMVNVIKQ